MEHSRQNALGDWEHYRDGRLVGYDERDPETGDWVHRTVDRYGSDTYRSPERVAADIAAAEHQRRRNRLWLVTALIALVTHAAISMLAYRAYMDGGQTQPVLAVLAGSITLGAPFWGILAWPHRGT